LVRAGRQQYVRIEMSRLIDLGRAGLAEMIEWPAPGEE
jgi:hypothetical protein